ncbi:TPA: GNAT family N-acetyltransferase [Vibrio parahaemolyticus]|uniref:GNAT family N-acetyltransferase n=1 Tax=Vibrio parahaemolyticus TaxID=670 RepID=UPI000A394639|nr:GNAT family N-acetyltransferase [Vibrio parahaemolyticus]EHR1165337.1 GNAT family N-acetyltransferase [Vibrio parahaemolyticus]EIA1557573.1 GNAT family N-acetyltransferase [Vibrio parahaemolyticus]EJR0682585.1 GNAT family N-acetyltransferase [Vibrio parahaemolyticus]ELA9435230.1 GNAT family N-acetyltransferase [Vibrio parahaemolyticus]MBE3681108.1 GNAT family N-acetyltransferase [Vibrio parahaemolyticus]
MNIDLDELVRLGLISHDDENVIEKGILNDDSNNDIDYTVTFGWDLFSANNCDKSWKIYRFELAEYIEKNFKEEDRPAIFSQMQVEDYHWEWLSKSIVYQSDEYKWFYLKTEDNVEAACLAYHPKKSAVDSEDIFYIEFIAVAPWNRENPMSAKKLKGVGSTLLRATIKYLVDSLGLTYRFGLHALPQARGYYQKIGMDYIPIGDKDSLEYFEMSDNNSMTFVNR